MLDPLFVFYCPRSGSTFFTRLLVEKLGFAGPPETNFIPRLLSRGRQVVGALGSNGELLCSMAHTEALLDIVFEDAKFRDWEIDRGDIWKQLALQSSPFELRDIISSILMAYRDRHYPKAQVCVLKKDSNLQYVDELRMLFPQARNVCLVRDGRAVFNSQKRSLHSGSGKPFETDPKRAAEAWSTYVRRVRQLEAEHPHSTLVTRYEDILSDGEEVVEQVRKLIEVDAKGDDLRFEYNIPDRYGLLHQNVDKPPMQERATAWRTELHACEIERFERNACRVLMSEGYELVNPDAAPKRGLLGRMLRF